MVFISRVRPGNIAREFEAPWLDVHSTNTWVCYVPNRLKEVGKYRLGLSSLVLCTLDGCELGVLSTCGVKAVKAKEGFRFRNGSIYGAVLEKVAF